MNRRRNIWVRAKTRRRRETQMEFRTEAHKTVYEKTRNYLNTLFGEINVKTMDDTFVLQEGSTFVYVRTFPIGDKKAGVEIFSYVVVDIDVTEDLMRYLL